MSIGGSVRAFGFVAAAVFLFNAVLAAVAIGQLRIGGPDYVQIISGKDLVADILPPPEYILEAYLEATLAIDEPKSVDSHSAKLRKLHDDFNERRAYWDGSQLPSSLKNDLKAGIVAAQPFWDAVETGLIPNLKAGDLAEARQAYARAQNAYAEHRAAIDRLVESANAFSAGVEQEAAQRKDTFSMLLYGGSALGLCIILLGSATIVRRVVRPLASITGAMKALAAGDTSISVPALRRHDEIGAIASAVQAFKEAAVATIALENEAADTKARADHEHASNELSRADATSKQAQAMSSIATGLERLAGGDLSFRLDQALAPVYEKLRVDFNGAIAKLQDTMVVIAGSASAIRSGTSEISSASDDLSRRTEQQAASLEETAAALDEITATVKKTSDGSVHARTVVSNTKADAERSGVVVGQAVEAMSAIEQSAQKVTQIIGVIDEIAFQTNLLALNAGVEAARAGEAGRGFAVVASEVRALAQRSAEAAKEIKALISTSSQQVSTGVDLVNETGDALKRIVSQVAEINVVVSDIATSTQEQATALQEVNTAINQMDQVTQQNAAMVEQSTAASKNLAQETEELARLVGQFRLDRSPAVRSAVVPLKVKSAPKTVAALKPMARGGAAPRVEHSAENWEEF